MFLTVLMYLAWPVFISLLNFFQTYPEKQQEAKLLLLSMFFSVWRRFLDENMRACKEGEEIRPVYSVKEHAPFTLSTSDDGSEEP
ncbi:hypothetical protein CSA56_15160 [candidate division KSB3 bacterium]|uniref:Uncharacterized protein n=1 Tax=candidate division KSB3 bacterium TaxID=2044937 RepID=A0A2G6KB04_9BACT|nr:MAG: hypothetical protein CSA56_15160 [candidate division KSB3 bacterium]